MKRILTIIVLALISFQAGAQSRSILGGILDSTLNKKNIAGILENVVGGAVSKLDLPLEGTWAYSQPKVQFKSENKLAEAGGTLAANAVEKTIGKLYGKIGVDADYTYTFNSDSTFTQVVRIAGRTVDLKGTYSLDKANHMMRLDYKVAGRYRMGSVSAIYVNTGKSLALLFDANELYGFFKKIVSSAGSFGGKAGLSVFQGLVDKYDGMLVGYKMERR